jgi:NADH dehydrogenase
MILVTGATGFVGQALLNQLIRDKQPIACLLRPSSHERSWPAGQVRVDTGTLYNLPSLRVAMHKVDTVIHLVGAWRDLNDKTGETMEKVNYQGTANLVEAALDAGVRHIIYLSHIHADRNSAYPVLRTKGAAEEAIRSSGLNYTILRSSLIFGPGDAFTTTLAMLLKIIPVVFPVTGEGKTRFQPIHVQDVARCLAGSVQAYHLEDAILDIGGPQHLSYNEVLSAVMEAIRVHRVRVQVRMPVMRALVRLMEAVFPNALVSDEQLDLFSVDNTTDLGNVPRNFDFEPRRFTEHLAYLNRRGWRRAFLRHAFRNRGQ